MKSQYPLTAFQAVHNTLVILCLADETVAQSYLAYLSQQGEPYRTTTAAVRVDGGSTRDR